MLQAAYNHLLLSLVLRVLERVAPDDDVAALHEVQLTGKEHHSHPSATQFPKDPELTPPSRPRACCAATLRIRRNGQPVHSGRFALRNSCRTDCRRGGASCNSGTPRTRAPGAVNLSGGLPSLHVPRVRRSTCRMNHPPTPRGDIPGTSAALWNPLYGAEPAPIIAPRARQMIIGSRRRAGAQRSAAGRMPFVYLDGARWTAQGPLK